MNHKESLNLQNHQSYSLEEYEWILLKSIKLYRQIKETTTTSNEMPQVESKPYPIFVHQKYEDILIDFFLQFGHDMMIIFFNSDLAFECMTR